MKSKPESFQYYLSEAERLKLLEVAALFIYHGNLNYNAASKSAIVLYQTLKQELEELEP